MDIMEVYRRNWIKDSDPKMQAITLYGSVFWVPILIFSYLYFTLRCGPRFMKDRKPYSLKTFIMYYNIFQIVANAIIAYHCCTIVLPWKTENFCKPLQDVNPDQYQMFTTLMGYVLVVKLIDFIETGVFVLRKKDNQITFLHVYHHVSTVLIVWLGVNTFGTTWQKILSPIKPLLTSIQMVQLMFLIFALFQTYKPGCYFSKFAEKKRLRSYFEQDANKILLCASLAPREENYSDALTCLMALQ
ncbi:hypothetical protein KM043_009717 [Ampulex compressa]|nr:hypothetical protein KM043_009717 [Ampulex compressa]